MMALQVRRVITGHDANGKAIVASDERMAGVSAPARPYISRCEIWSTDKMPVDNSEAAAAAQRKGFVVRHNYVGSGQGTVVRITEFAPGAPKSMHRTETVDYAILLSGECDLELDDGKMVHLKQGDIVVQRGTMHAWVNNGSVPCVFAFILIDAEPVEAGGKKLTTYYPTAQEDRGVSPDKIDGCPLADQFGEGERVPIGQPDAAMRLRLADLVGLGRAVDAVTFGRKGDPDEAHRVVRPRPDRHRVPDLLFLEVVSRVVGVGRVLGHRPHDETPARRRLLGAADRGGVECDQPIVGAINQDGMVGLVDHHPRGGRTCLCFRRRSARSGALPSRGARVLALRHLRQVGDGRRAAGP